MFVADNPRIWAELDGSGPGVVVARGLAPGRQRPQGGALRVLFMFDPRRQVILLLGGDKTGEWSEWYHWAVPAADDLYDIYLDELQEEGLI